MKISIGGQSPKGNNHRGGGRSVLSSFPYLLIHFPCFKVSLVVVILFKNFDRFSQIDLILLGKII